MTAFLLVIGYLHSAPPFHTVSRRLLVYLFLVRKTFVIPAGISAWSLIYGRHYTGLAILMPRSRRSPAAPRHGQRRTQPVQALAPMAYSP